MAFRINYNYLANFTLTQLHSTESQLNKVVTQLSSGRRIVTAADDVSGYNIVQRLTKVSKGIEQGIMNSQDGMSLAQVALSATQQMIDNYQTVRQKALQAANETVNPSERKQIGVEIAKIIEAMDRLAQQVDFNEFKLFQSANLNANGVHYNSFGYKVEGFTLAEKVVLNYSAGAAGSVGPTSAQISAYKIVGDNGDVFYLAKITSKVDSNFAGVSALALINAGALTDGILTSSDLKLVGSTLEKTELASFLSYNENLLAYQSTLGKVSITFTDFGKYSTALSGDFADLNGDTYQFMVQYGPAAAAGKTSFGTNGTGDNRIFVATFTENIFSNVLRIQIKDKNYQEIAQQLFDKYGFGSGATESKILDFANKVGQLINVLSDRAADLGSTINQLQSIVNFNEQAKTTIDEATSRIRDVDFAKATAKFQQLQILMQSGTAMLAQANQLPQYALRLVG